MWPQWSLSLEYGHALLVLTRWSKSKTEVVREQKTSQVAHAFDSSETENIAPECPSFQIQYSEGQFFITGFFVFTQI